MHKRPTGHEATHTSAREATHTNTCVRGQKETAKLFAKHGHLTHPPPKPSEKEMTGREEREGKSKTGLEKDEGEERQVLPRGRPR